ncbi:transglutaminase-like domain-containing protein [Rhodopirellula halodulae]|uniref:transglutaminase-like domain-containing protein n=1 Tax=Rhodopirellula halodulae TaxID=2894198 RepID=UPI001E3DC3CD|nr:transglutaminase-like domain-containing protein [Rhodopirellula sp. JC737]MCC9656029.1 transglutaminase-like domain-containing protein [Rhodopirellula sp. JC737]
MTRPMDWRDWLTDNRTILGALTVGLAFFIGGTFVSTPGCLTFAIIAVVAVVVSHLRETRAGETTSPVKQESWKKQLIRGLLLFVSLVGGVFLVFVWRFVPALQGVPNILLVAVDTIGHTAFVLLCILWIRWPKHGHVMMLILGMIVVLMAVAGGGLSTTVTAQTGLGLIVCVGFVFAAHVISGNHDSTESAFQPLSSGGTSDAYRNPKRMSAGLFRFFALFAMLVAASATTHATIAVLPEVQAGVMAQLNERLEANTTRGWGGGDRYVNGSRIGNVRESILNDPANVALRGFAETEPGYLRGNVYDSYSDGRWRTSRKWIFQSPPDSGVRRVAEARFLRSTGPATVPLREMADHQRRRYSMRFGSVEEEVDDSIQLLNWNGVEGADPGGGDFVGTIEIQGDPAKGRKVFLPATTRWVELAGEGVGVSPHGLLSYGVEVRHPWVVAVQDLPPAETLYQLERDSMTRVETAIEREAARLTRELVRGASTDAEKAERIAEHFQSNYQYSLKPVTVPEGLDPLIHFLRSRHPAHCELFASATALMLRTEGIPSRYVTGYIMDELNDAGDAYLARNRDAHAWVEYFDRESSRWLPVESTPGRSYFTLRRKEQALLAAGGDGGADAAEDVSTSFFSPLLQWWASVRTTDTLVTLFRWAQVPLLIFLVAVLWRRNRGNEIDERSVRLAAERRRMDRRIRRLGWVRSPSETLHRFATRLEVETTDSPAREELLRAADWYRDHAVACYRGEHEAVKLSPPVAANVPA